MSMTSRQKRVFDGVAKLTVIWGVFSTFIYFAHPSGFVYVLSLGAVFLVLVVYSEAKAVWTIRGSRQPIQYAPAHRREGWSDIASDEGRNRTLGLVGHDASNLGGTTPFNIASELPMSGNFDIAGNPYGIDLDNDR